MTVREAAIAVYVNDVLNHYTPASFVRLLALAGHRLRLQTEHFEALLSILSDSSFTVSAPNRSTEQASQHVNSCKQTAAAMLSPLHVRVFQAR